MNILTKLTSMITALIPAVAILVSCNKDDVIELPETGQTEPESTVISLPLTGNNLTLAVGSEYLFTPEISHNGSGDPEIRWTLDGETAGTGCEYLFKATAVGNYRLTVTASDSYGESTREIVISVVERLPWRLSFPTPSYYQTSTTRYTFAGRPVYITPLIENLDGNSFRWTVNGDVTECTSETFIFTADKPGEYTVSLTVDNLASASLKVICVEGAESDHYRKPTAGSKATSISVFEWVPAPGQFIGETTMGEITTPDDANDWAQKRLNNSNYVSLGGFGGYITVGFDHSIQKRDGQFDFSVTGNAFLNAGSADGGSNEPGIVWVMQDVNGNGIPDDEWYELRGSETGNPQTCRNYAVTYYRPAGPKMNVQWTDNHGLRGTIDYLSAFHRQDYYYPAWITSDSYTLYGTCLQAKTTQNSSTGFWDNSAFSWGYADNKGSDDLSNSDSPDGPGGEGQRNGFMIENAMYPDLTHINLQYIDFIKIQTGLNTKAGWLGEVSTEVFSFQDLSMTTK